MKPEVEIRRATLDDYDAVCAMFRELDSHHVELLPDKFRAFEGPVRTLERFSEKVSSSDAAFFVAVSQTTLIGFVDVQQDSNPPLPMFKAKTFAVVDNLFVVSEHRGTGTAHSLLEHAKVWAKERGLSSIQLKVYSANGVATRFYQKEGMIPLSTTFEADL